MEKKSAMNKVVFTRKALESAELQRGTWQDDSSASVVVERVVELPPDSYARFADNLLANCDFLRAHQERMYVDTQGVWHCLLVKAQGAKDGILVNAEGCSYARYAAYCPDVEPFLPQPRQQEQESERRRGNTPRPTNATRSTTTEAVGRRRLFLVTYDYTESGETERCGFLCEATTIRQAAEMFWSQHRGNGFPCNA